MHIRQKIARHGLRATLYSSILRLIGRLLPISVAEVSYSPNVSDHALTPGYKNRMLDEAEFHDALKQMHNGADLPVRHEAFQRGDRCVATFFLGGGEAEEMVGYNFYSTRPTTVNEEIEFFFSRPYQYSYAAYTADAHRGLRLSPSRWTYYRNWRQAHGETGPTISYIELTNLASLSSGGQDDRVVCGHTGYIKLGKLLRCWRSPGCKKHGAGFRRIS